MFIFIIIFSVNFWTCTCISTRLCVVSISWGGFACGSWLNLIDYCFRSLFPAFYSHPIELQVFFSECVLRLVYFTYACYEYAHFGQGKKWMLKVRIRIHAWGISIVSFVSIFSYTYKSEELSRCKYSYKYLYAIRIIDRKADIITLWKRAFLLFD